jgi:4-amino-4-deoxy-L-arabinose transferase-like glycosyltransferase
VRVHPRGGVQLGVLAALLATAFSFVTPVGEAPDELAHLAYVRHLAASGRLPDPPAVTDGSNYEAHQPPLGYVVPAALLASIGGDLVVDPRPNPRFSFVESGSRAFVAPVDRAGRRTVIALRAVNAVWAFFTTWLAFRLAVRLIGEKTSPWLCAPFLLVPQFLFISGVLSNDGLTTLWSTLALGSLATFVGKPLPRTALAATAALGGALLTKGTALFLLAPIALAAVIGAKTNRRAALALISGAGAACAAWAGVNVWRFGTLLPRFPSQPDAGSLQRLWEQPRWIASLFRSYWAKFGWLNTPMPAVTYCWFAVLSLAVAAGAVVLLRRPETHDRALLLCTALMSNLALLLAFMVRVDWQPQGRLLFPSLAAAAGLGAASLALVPARWRTGVTAAALAVTVLVALGAVFTVARAY